MRRRTIWIITVLFVVAAFAVLILTIKNMMPTPAPNINKGTAAPAASVMPTTAAVPAALTPVPTETSTTTYKVVVPSAYRETGIVPVYRAAACDFTEIVQPEWFNESGIAEMRNETSLVFKDHATLQYSADCLEYIQYSDEMYDYNTTERERYGRDIAPYVMRVPAMPSFIANIAEFAQNVAIEQKQLTYVSLDDAQNTAKEMLEKLGLHDYTCSYALDMSVERIHELGESYNRFWYESDAFNNSPRMDYNRVTNGDEGYYLVFTPMGDDTPNETPIQARFFINRAGIAFMSVQNAIYLGDPFYTPNALISPEQAISVLKTEAVISWVHQPVQTVHKVALVYRAMKTDGQTEGMIYTPVWYIEYKDADSINQDYYCWGEIDAVNGKLIRAIFKE